MRRPVIILAVCASAVAWLFGAVSEAQAQRGYYYRGGYGFYRPYYPGWYRPYPFIGVGVGVGFYAPYYGSYAYPVAPGYVYPASPYGYPPGIAGSGPDGAMPPGMMGQPPKDRPPPDNAGHLQLMVPADADVFVDGQKISQTGATREIVTPALQPGTRYTYKISVRYADAQGKQIDDTREISFQANDWFSIDFTRAAPPRAPAAPPPQPLPNQLR
jgi:uncharacterized protein (TIGR03000 family)